MDKAQEVIERYQYLKSRRRLNLLKDRVGICYHNLMNKTKPVTENALMHIRDAYNVALKLEIAELKEQKKIIESRLMDIKKGSDNEYI